MPEDANEPTSTDITGDVEELDLQAILHRTLCIVEVLQTRVIGLEGSLRTQGEFLDSIAQSLAELMAGTDTDTLGETYTLLEQVSRTQRAWLEGDTLREMRREMTKEKS